MKEVGEEAVSLVSDGTCSGSFGCDVWCVLSSLKLKFVAWSLNIPLQRARLAATRFRVLRLKVYSPVGNMNSPRKARLSLTRTNSLLAMSDDDIEVPKLSDLVHVSSVTTCLSIPLLSSYR
jgi:hypothetical protein